MKFILSPEFHRQLWLRFSPFRMLAAPLVIILCFFATSNLPKNVGGIAEVDMTSMLYLALTIYYLVAIVWGTYEAATAMQEELRGNTWDFQRMSSISPAQLSLGKLFGATSYTWYFGALALCVITYAYANHHEPELGPSRLPAPDDDTSYVLFCLVAAGLIAQSVAFLYSFADSLFLFGRTGRTKPPRGIWAFAIGVFAGTEVFVHVVKIEALHLQPRAYAMLYHFNLTWYGHDVERGSFTIWSLLFFIGWFLCGSYRIARAELLYRNLPTVWVAFVASVVAWNSGFLVRATPLMGEEIKYFHVLMSAFMQVLFISYLCMITEASDARGYARLAFYARKGDVLRALENTPKWLATVPLVLIMFVAVMMTATDTRPPFDFAHATAFMISLMLFMVRDGCAIHAIHLGVRGRGNSFAILFYYLLAYGLLPLVSFTSLSMSMNEVINGVVSMKVPDKISRIAGAFYPTAMLDPVMSIFPVLVEAVAMGVWLYTRINRNYKTAAPPAKA